MSVLLHSPDVSGDKYCLFAAELRDLKHCTHISVSLPISLCGSVNYFIVNEPTVSTINHYINFINY